MAVMQNVFVSDVEIDEINFDDTVDWDEFDWGEDVEESESWDMSIMEHLLYAQYYQESDDAEYLEVMDYEKEEWLELWRKYVELDEKNNVVWKFNGKISGWNVVERILRMLEQLKAEDKEVFQKAFTGNFISCLLLEISQDLTLNEPQISRLADWIQKHKSKKFDQQDFWRVLKHFYRNNTPDSIFVTTELSRYSRLWRTCTLKPIFISMKDEIQKNTFIYYTGYSSDRVYFNYLEDQNIDMLLDFCDGVVHYERYNNQAWVNLLLQEGNKEMLYACFKKNFINKRMAQNALDTDSANKQCDLVPLLMLKAHGEWPEEKVKG